MMNDYKVVTQVGDDEVRAYGVWAKSEAQAIDIAVAYTRNLVTGYLGEAEGGIDNHLDEDLAERHELEAEAEAEEAAEVCEECGAPYPASATSVFGPWHKGDCSLHPSNVVGAEGTYKSFEVRADLSEVIDLDLEGFLDLLGERAGKPLLMDVTYKVVGHDGDTLRIKVTGDTSMDDADAEAEAEAAEGESETGRGPDGVWAVPEGEHRITIPIEPGANFETYLQHGEGGSQDVLFVTVHSLPEGIRYTYDEAEGTER